MIKNYWYIVAFSVVIVILTIQLEQIYLSIGFFLWLLVLFYKQKVSVYLLLLSIATFLFYYYYIPSPEEVHSTPNIQLKDEVEISGKVISQINPMDSRIEFTFQVSQSDMKVLVIYFLEDSTSIPHTLSRIQTGSTCKLTGIISKPDTPTNPHQFDYRTYLLQQGLAYQMYIEDTSTIVCGQANIIYSISKLRDLLLKSTLEKLDEDTVAWLHALVLGDDRYIDDKIVDLFQRWGLSHLLAISGLHVGIIVGLLYIILVRFSIWTKETAQWIIMSFLPLYALLAGGQPSVLRASLMVLFVLILNKLKWQLNYTDVISIVFLLLILFDPFIVYHIGFQLSFAVTFGLIISQNWIAQTPSNIMKLLRISFISQMIILPLQLHYFHLFQPLSIILNLLIVPYFSLFVIPIMFGLLLLHWLPHFILNFISTMFIRIHQIILSLVQWIDIHLDYPFTIGEIPLSFSIVYYLILIVVMINLEKKKINRAFQVSLAITTMLIVLTLRPFFSPVGSVTMLDIGQGDAIIIELPYRKGVFFIDIGTPVSFPDFEPTNKAYKQVIQPYLLGQGITKIDAVFISHKHYDHYGSLPFVYENFKIDEVVVSPYFEIDDVEITWDSIEVDLFRMSFNESIIRKGYQFQAVSPYKDYADENENSLVLYTEIGGMRWLFTGDVYKRGEIDIVSSYPHLNVDVLKVGHHGSNTSTDPSFIEAIGANYALISAGRNNMYGHPNEEVLQTLTDQNVQVFRTDQDGAVQYIFTKEKGFFKSFLNNKK